MSAIAIDMKMTFVLEQIKLIFTGKILHPKLPLFWKGEILDLENGPLFTAVSRPKP